MGRHEVHPLHLPLGGLHHQVGSNLRHAEADDADQDKNCLKDQNKRRRTEHDCPSSL